MTLRTKYARPSATRLWLATFAITLTTVLFAVACGNSSSSDTGAEAPDFSLPVANGAGNITLSQYQGDKNVVLVFYRGFF